MLNKFNSDKIVVCFGLTRLKLELKLDKVFFPTLAQCQIKQVGVGQVELGHDCFLRGWTRLMLRLEKVFCPPERGAR